MMLPQGCPRWRNGRDRYRPAGEVIDTSQFEVAPIASDNVARAFVVQHHYSRSFPAARFRFGLYERGELVGVAVYSHPVRELALRPLPVDAAVELGRFVLLDRVAANAETWFLARTFEHLRKEPLAGVVSFSDPYPRETADGRVVFGGHVGTIYQAMNAVYLGQARTDTARLLPDGRTLHNRSLQKLRTRERGWQYVVDELVRYGAPPPAGDHDAWIEQSLASLVRRVRRPGNHKYVWAFSKTVRRGLPTSQPYPKMARAA